MKKYCNTCKHCSDVENNAVVSCYADCIWKERPSYIKYMKELEKDNASINPVTGDRNDRCPARHSYGYSTDYHSADDPEPDRYVKCAVRNKRLDCRHYVKTDKVPYISDVLCPHCNKKMDICSDRFHGGFYTQDNIHMKPDDCEFICIVDEAGRIVDFDVYKDEYDHYGDEYDGYGEYDHYGIESGQRSRRLGAVVVEVKTRLGIEICRSDYGWTDGGDYYKNYGCTDGGDYYKKKEGSTTPNGVSQDKRRSFWRWLTSDGMVIE